jgi:hypothetical protein
MREALSKINNWIKGKIIDWLGVPRYIENYYCINCQFFHGVKPFDDVEMRKAAGVIKSEVFCNEKAGRKIQ